MQPKSKPLVLFRIFALFSALLLIVSCTLSPTIEQVKFETNHFEADIRGQTIQIRGVAENSIEVLYLDATKTAFPSFAKSARSDFRLRVRSGDQGIEIQRGLLTAILNKSTGEIHFKKGTNSLTTQSSVAASGDVGFSFSLASNEQLMGGGERVLGMDRRGYKLPLYNKADYGYETESIQMNYGLPAVMSSRGYYLLFDNTAKGELDLGATDSKQLQFSAVGGRKSYFIGVTEKLPELVTEFVNVTGKPVMPPRWALGHFISRFGYHSEREVRETVALTQTEAIPADAVILDLYWFGADIKGHMGNLDWDRAHFPNPEQMIKDLSENDIKTILITEPFILTSSKRWDEAVSAKALATDVKGEPYRFDFYFGNTGLIDIFSERGRDWFASHYQRLFEQGVAGSWGDLGEPEVHPDDIIHELSVTGESVRGDVLHNVYGHEWARLVYETQKSIAPDSRPLILMRSGFAGSQRYGLIPWTGDVSRSWGGLKPQVELSLQMGLFGLGYTHSDLGGFAGAEAFDKELYLRWLLYGVFQPVFRPHAQEHIASEPVFHDPETVRLSREFIKLRYRLLPYHYTLAYEHSQTGMPLMRPLFFDYPDLENVIEEKQQYLWGDAFLVQPVTDPGLDSVSVKLPPGQWFNFWDSQRHQGNQTIDYPLSLETIPVLVKAGAFIPMVEDYSSIEQYDSQSLTVHYYHHPEVTSSTGGMFEDDGQSATSIERGAYEILSFDSRYRNKILELSLKRQGGDYPGRPEVRHIDLIIHGLNTKPDQIYSNGTEITDYEYRPDTGQLKVTFDWSKDAKSINITWK